MSYEMKQLRKEDLSLYYHIKHVALIDFIEFEEYAPLNELELHEACTDNIRVYAALVEWCQGEGAMYETLPNPTERGRGWVYLDEEAVLSGTYCGTTLSGYVEQSERVFVYTISGSTISGVPYMEYVRIPDTEYLIDYMDGRVIASGTCQPTNVSYYWNYVSVVDEWAAIEAAKPPVVVLDLYGTDKGGYQLGGGKKITRKVDIHVFASNPAERNDIVESIFDSLYLKSCPLYDFPEGTILDYDGTWFGKKDIDTPDNKLTYLFNRTTSPNIIGNLTFENVTARHVSLPLVMTRDRNEVMLSDLNAYRSKISFDLISYTKV
jgi:hypothetical protein